MKTIKDKLFFIALQIRVFIYLSYVVECNTHRIKKHILFQYFQLALMDEKFWYMQIGRKRISRFDLLRFKHLVFDKWVTYEGAKSYIILTFIEIYISRNESYSFISINFIIKGEWYLIQDYMKFRKSGEILLCGGILNKILKRIKIFKSKEL